MKRPFHCPAWLAAGLAIILVATACRSGSDSAKAASPATGPTTKAAQAAMTPAQALAELKAGNARFVAGQPRPRQPLADLRAAAAGQYPFAVVLSCIDSRQPIELVLDQGVGDIFSTRVAGNVLNDDVLACMEFACQVSGAKLIAVIGHSNCGAIKGAIDHVELGNLTGLLAHVQPAIDAVPDDGQPRNSKNHEFVQKVAEANVRLALRKIPERSPVLKKLLDEGKIGLVGGIYDLETGKVEFFQP